MITLGNSPDLLEKAGFAPKNYTFRKMDISKLSFIDCGNSILAAIVSIEYYMP